MSEPSATYLIECATNTAIGKPGIPTAISPNETVVAFDTTPHVNVRPEETPSDYIPGLYSLGSTYDVLNGKYADPKSTIQQIVDWNLSGVRVQTFGGKRFSVPDVVNFSYSTSTDYRSSYGKTTSEYSKSLSNHAGFEATFPGFSSSASGDYSDSARENLSHAFTRVTFSVTHYTLSLPPISQVKRLLKDWFVDELEKANPIDLYREYGTHLLLSLTVGGRALFLNSTDTRSYSSTTSLEAAAKISASYSVAKGNIELSTAQKQAMESFNESSDTAIVTKGGNPRYGNENFLKNVEEWAESILEFPEFVDFGSMPAFAGLWELASSPARREVLLKAYTQFVTLYTRDLSMPGPYIHAQSTKVYDESKGVGFVVANKSGHFQVQFPYARSDSWYMISPAISGEGCTIAKELVPGALAPVKWVEAFTVPFYDSRFCRFWKAVPPSDDYIALGCVAMTARNVKDLPEQPSKELNNMFRAVHKGALTGAVYGVEPGWGIRGTGVSAIYGVDFRYWGADREIPRKTDCYMLDPKMAVKDWTGN